MLVPYVQYVPVLRQQNKKWVYVKWRNNPSIWTADQGAHLSVFCKEYLARGARGKQCNTGRKHEWIKSAMTRSTEKIDDFLQFRDTQSCFIAHIIEAKPLHLNSMMYHKENESQFEKQSKTKERTPLAFQYIVETILSWVFSVCATFLPDSVSSKSNTDLSNSLAQMKS